MPRATEVSRYLGTEFKASDTSASRNWKHVNAGFTAREGSDGVVYVEYNHYNYGRDLDDKHRDAERRKWLDQYREWLEHRYHVTDNRQEGNDYFDMLIVRDKT